MSMNTKTESKICVDCKNEFEIDSGDLLLYEKIGLEVPEQCFFCRLKQYSAFWVFGKFRKGKSDLSNESLITVLPNNPRYPIYKSHEWFGDAWHSKNCYLSRSVFKCENLSYGYRIVECKDCFDIALSFNLQNSFECLACHNSFNLNFSENSKDCIDSYFLFDCRNCQNCFMCWNL